MIGRRFFILACTVLVAASQAFAKCSPQDTIVPLVDENQQIEDDLDSLLNLWYVKNSIKSTDVSLNMPDAEVKINEITDSVLIERLNAIPSLIELPYNEIIRRWIEIYTRSKSAPVLLGLADYYFPMFEEILDRNDLPIELKYLPVIESALNPRAVSRAGATGLWQFMYGTGRMYQLEINSFVDERRDPYQSSIAAAKYLNNLYEVYKDWTLVIAAYNCGPGNVNKAIRRANGKRDYWDIYPYLPRETRGYVPAFIGAIYMINYYDKHNIKPLQIKMPMMTDTIMVEQKLHLMQVAEVLNIPIDELRDLNPQYKIDILPSTGDAYPLRLTFEQSMAFIDNQDSIFAYKDSIFFNPQRVVVTPKTKKYTKRNYYSYYTSYTPPSTDNKTKLLYTVKTGDVIGLIADWYDVSISDIKYWNRMHRNTIRVGQKLIVYVPNKKVHYYKKVDNLSLAEKNETNSRYSTSTATTDVKKDGSYIYHTISQGESLYTIAQEYEGVTFLDLKKINNLSSYQAKNLKPGQVIKIKKKG